MLDHGRDVYGTQYSPLFAEALDRKTMQLLDGDALQQVAALPFDKWGIRPHDRMLGGANPQHCQNLYQILYALSTLTGEPRYAEAADQSLQFFFTHCQNPATGLLWWGEHAGWDFRTEQRIEKAAGTTHEFYRPWVLWERSWQLAPEPCRRFALGLWEHQIGNQQTGDYSRHAAIDKHGPGTDAPYVRHGGFYIETWATAYEKTGTKSSSRRSTRCSAAWNAPGSKKAACLSPARRRRADAPPTTCRWLSRWARPRTRYRRNWP